MPVQPVPPPERLPQRAGAMDDWEVGPGKMQPSKAQEGTSGKAIASLILGLISCTCLPAIPGLILGILGLSDINKSYGRVGGRGLAISGIILNSLGLVMGFLVLPVALLLPAVQAAREAARRAQCVNNFKQIGLAMHNHHDSMNRFPGQAIVGKDGTPLLSWRVAILPYIEQSQLYNEFHLDEPWDSPHNQSLLSKMPPTYACPSQFGTNAPSSGMTTYQVLVGPQTMFDNPLGAQIASITDGTSNTLLVVESTKPVPWTKPEDIDVAEGQPPVGLGSKHPGGFNALMVDGSVRFIKLTVSPMILRALATRNGNEVIDLSSF
jgi:prepilin-type processing-associated H-X9-DG protein